MGQSLLGGGGERLLFGGVRVMQAETAAADG